MSFTLSAVNQCKYNSKLKMATLSCLKSYFHYKQSNEYNREGQFTIKWNDPSYGIWWPISNPILSQRDLKMISSDFSGKKVMVCGGAGFIGTNLILSLKKTSAEILQPFLKNYRSKQII